MLGYIKKKKVLKIIENAHSQVLEAQSNIVLLDKEGCSEKDFAEWRDSYKELDGAMKALNDLKKNFQ